MQRQSSVTPSFSYRARCELAACFVYVFLLLYFRMMVGCEADGPLWWRRTYLGGLPRTYDLEVILKYCGKSSYDLRSQSHLEVLWEIFL